MRTFFVAAAVAAMAISAPALAAKPANEPKTVQKSAKIVDLGEQPQPVQDIEFVVAGTRTKVAGPTADQDYRGLFDFRIPAGSQRGPAQGTMSPQGVYQSLLSLSAVPEASTWVMLISGFGAVGAAMRRRGRHSAIEVRPS